jgi:hypothetical protein
MVSELHAPAALPPGKEPRIGGWVGLRDGVDAVEQRSFPCSYRETNPGRLARSYTDWAIPGPKLLTALLNKL